MKNEKRLMQEDWIREFGADYTPAMVKRKSFVEVVRNLEIGGPLKPNFGLSGSVLLPDRVWPPLFRVFAPVTSTCIRR